MTGLSDRLPNEPRPPLDSKPPPKPVGPVSGLSDFARLKASPVPAEPAPEGANAPTGYSGSAQGGMPRPPAPPNAPAGAYGPGAPTPETDAVRVLVRQPMKLSELERYAIEAALERTGGNVTRAMRQLGIGRTTLYRKLKKYGLR